MGATHSADLINAVAGGFIGAAIAWAIGYGFNRRLEKSITKLATLTVLAAKDPDSVEPMPDEKGRLTGLQHILNAEAGAYSVTIAQADVSSGSED